MSSIIKIAPSASIVYHFLVFFFYVFLPLTISASKSSTCPRICLALRISIDCQQWKSKLPQNTEACYPIFKKLPQNTEACHTVFTKNKSMSSNFYLGKRPTSPSPFSRLSKFSFDLFLPNVPYWVWLEGLSMGMDLTIVSGNDYSH